MYKFHFLGFENTNINDKDFIKIYVLDLNNRYVHTIYKLSNKNLIDKLHNIKVFEDISTLISFAIKRNGKISLDIK